VDNRWEFSPHGGVWESLEPHASAFPQTFHFDYDQRRVSCDQRDFFPEVSVPALYITHFLRGVFDVDGFMAKPSSQRSHRQKEPMVKLRVREDLLVHIITAFCQNNDLNTPSEDRNWLVWHGNNALDFMAKLYDNAPLHWRSNVKYAIYVSWAGSGSTSALNFPEHYLPYVKWAAGVPDAVPPSKKRASDVGYDLTLVSVDKKLTERTTLYDTGIVVQPSYGYYVDVVPRSSLSKSGYVMANSVGIIDRSYTGTIKVALTKVDDSAPDIELPFRGAQMILMVAHHFKAIGVPVNQIQETERGEGGFGSTGGVQNQVHQNQDRRDNRDNRGRRDRRDNRDNNRPNRPNRNQQPNRRPPPPRHRRQHSTPQPVETSPTSPTSPSPEPHSPTPAPIPQPPQPHVPFTGSWADAMEDEET
jgi:deoxyuridine 5'-triphosphate nucleotidohydrolase